MLMSHPDNVRLDLSLKQFIGPHVLLQNDVTPSLNLTTLLILTTPVMLNLTFSNSLTLLIKGMRPGLVISLREAAYFVLHY